MISVRVVLPYTSPLTLTGVHQQFRNMLGCWESPDWPRLVQKKPLSPRLASKTVPPCWGWNLGHHRGSGMLWVHACGDAKKTENTIRLSRISCSERPLDKIKGPTGPSPDEGVFGEHSPVPAKKEPSELSLSPLPSSSPPLSSPDRASLQ